MISKLLSTIFAISIVWSSIGVQVIQHDCVWCGGERIEFVEKPAANEGGSCCGSEKDDSHHSCGEDGCCQPKLLKFNAVASSHDGMVVKNICFLLVSPESGILLPYFQFRSDHSGENHYLEKLSQSSFIPPPAFPMPLRI
jgi:hypothetical protein